MKPNNKDSASLKGRLSGFQSFRSSWGGLDSNYTLNESRPVSDIMQNSSRKLRTPENRRNDDFRLCSDFIKCFLPRPKINSLRILRQRGSLRILGIGDHESGYEKSMQ